MYSLIKPLLFRMGAEQAHSFTTSLAGAVLPLPGIKALAMRSWNYQHPSLEKKVMGLTFPNPVGLAAGFDKNAEHIDMLAMLGFGFIEIGTVTPLPQAGNPKPRMFRLIREQALINRLGFNNEGMLQVARNLEKRKSNIIVGGNIGKNKMTTNEEAYLDYKKCFIELADLVDYFTINVSSPNTPNLRELQDKEPLRKILETVENENFKRRKPRPLLLKIAPDLNEHQLADITNLVKEVGFQGIISSNTTIRRDLILPSRTAAEQGGLSGKPIFDFSTVVLKKVRSMLPAESCLIGVGGIHNPQTALEKLQAGADLIQIYTGFVYQGPSFPSKINQLIRAHNI